jgi:hypothetical protein
MNNIQKAINSSISQFSRESDALAYLINGMKEAKTVKDKEKREAFSRRKVEIDDYVISLKTIVTS